MKNRFEINEQEYRSAMDGLRFSQAQKERIAQRLTDAGQEQPARRFRFSRRIITTVTACVLVLTLSVTALASSGRFFAAVGEFLGRYTVKEGSVALAEPFDIEVYYYPYEEGEGSVFRVTSDLDIDFPWGSCHSFTIDLDAEKVAKYLGVAVEDVPLDSELFQKVYAYAVDCNMIQEYAPHDSSASGNTFEFVMDVDLMIENALKYSGDINELREEFFGEK